MTQFLKQLAAGEEGATMVEYALMVALIAGAVVGIVTTLSSSISGQFNTVQGKIAGTSS